MKTLDDALSVAGIEPGEYVMPHGGTGYLATSHDGSLVRINAYLTPSELRRIADHLDPPASVPGKPDSSPVIPEGWALVPVEMTRAMKEAVRENGGEQAMLYALAAWYDLLPAAPKPPLGTEAAVRAEARREAFAEAEAQHRAAMEGYEAFCRAIGMEPDCYEAIAHQVNAKVARVRREALEEAAKVAESAYVVVERTDNGEIRQSVGHTAAAAISALIEKEPTA